MAETDPFKTFEENNGIYFNDKSLLKKAFTHRSYLNEHRDSGLEHNERLEFLGDAVLELVMTDELFKRYPETPEGELTALRAALVNTSMLATVAGELNMESALLLSRGEARDTGRARQYILANTFEAFVGAVYLDQGYESAQNFILRVLVPHLEEVVENRLWQDAKSRLQELSQEHQEITPEYKTLAEEGPDHDKQFTVGVYLGEEKAGQGVGKSKQEAEQAAARNALSEKGWE